MFLLEGRRLRLRCPISRLRPVKAPEAGQTIEQVKEGRILLIDQDDSVLETVKAILLEREHEVETAKTAADAMALLENRQFDLIVADLDLSGTAGRNILHDWIMARKPGMAKRCLWMRGVAPLGRPPDETPQNGNYILQKPFKAAELLAAVDGVLGSIETVPVVQR